MRGFKKLGLRTRITSFPISFLNCQYIDSIDYENPSSTEYQPIAFNGKLCNGAVWGANFNLDRTLNPSESGSVDIKACVDMNSLSYTPSYITINFDPEGICI